MYRLLLLTVLLFMVNGQEEEDGFELWEEGNFCCKSITNKRQCKTTSNKCIWLKKGGTDRQISKQKKGYRCLGKRYVECKRADITDDCQGNGTRSGAPVCLTDYIDPEQDANYVDSDDDEEDEEDTILDADANEVELWLLKADSVLNAEDFQLCEEGNFCCKTITDKRQCKQTSNNCLWLKKGGADKQISKQKKGYRCLGKRYVNCKRADITDDCSGDGNNVCGTRPVCATDYNKMLLDDYLEDMEEFDDDDDEDEDDLDDDDYTLWEEGNFCCKGITDKRQCKMTSNNCLWLKKGGIDRQISKQKKGYRCLGKRYVNCKRNDIMDDCSGDGSRTGAPICTTDYLEMLLDDDQYDEYYDDDEEEVDDEEILMNNAHFVQDGSYYSSVFNVKALCVLISAIMVLVCGYYMVYHRKNKQDDYVFDDRVTV